MKSILIRHFNFLSRSMELSIAGIRRRCDKRSIHSFRILVKKLRAFISLIKEIEPEMSGTGKEYRRLRKLFKEAGRIRDLQIQSEVLKEFNFFKDDGALLVAQKLKTKKAKKRFVKKLNGFNEKKTLERFSKKVKAVAAFCTNQKLTARIFDFSKENIADAVSLAENKSLHKSRIKLKNAHFCLDIIKSKPEANSLIATIDPIEQKVGKWQDCMITSRILEKSSGKSEAVKADQLRYQQLNHSLLREISRLEFQIQKDFKRLKRIIG